MPQPDQPLDLPLDDILARLSLDEKASLTGGRDVWHLPAIDHVGISALKMSDGPSGVRGEQWSTRRSLAFPCGLAVGATWDVELAGRVGTALGLEARSKGVHLLLGPTVCIIRTPLGGRTFESFAEDPHLTSRLTVAYITGVQAEGVGCCVKHFACNDQEHERMTISADVDETTLREVHLRPFEDAVTEAGVWAVMSAYNRVNGTYCGEHPELLEAILKGEWGFDGVVVSDWLGTHSTVEAATAGLDIEMPGPPSHLGAKLAIAVEAGEIDEGILDDHAIRILRLVDRCGAIGAPPPGAEAEEDDPARRAIAREVAIGGTVLLRNDGVLPLLSDRTLSCVALIGPHADWLETGGGGSSAVTPLRDRSLLAELRDRLPGVEIVHEEGCRLTVGVPRLDHRLLGDGLHIEYHADHDLDGTPAGNDRLHRSHLMTFGEPVPGVDATDFALRATATFTPDQTGTWQLGIATAGTGRLLLDGEPIADTTASATGATFFGLGSDLAATEVELTAGQTHSITVELHVNGLPIAGFELCGARPQRDDLIDRAVDVAATADIAVVVIGADSQFETEGADRPDLRLIGAQDDLVRRVAAANPRTVVVLNAGGPVELPWIDEVAAALTIWYPGEEGAAALADVLTGGADPGGRLPVTFPRRLEDTPAHAHYPGEDGHVAYGEGLLIGHRHYDSRSIDPEFCFGHGLSYTTFEYGEPSVAGDVSHLEIRVPVTNTGTRSGTEVVQAYIGPATPIPHRPIRQLAGFTKIDLAAGATDTAIIAVDRRALTAWDERTRSWVDMGGEHTISVGASSRDLRSTLSITLDP